MKADYERIERAIHFIQQNVGQQPDLKKVADHIGLSPYHFQRLFQRWAGVSPKRFLEYLTVERAKVLLQDSHSILDASIETGLSGPGRLHDHFVSIDAVSPGEYKNRGDNLEISYAFHESPFGELLLALTERGILALSFVERNSKNAELAKLKDKWCNAHFVEEKLRARHLVTHLFDSNKASQEKLLLSIHGTNFQVKVWNALLAIPCGTIVSYQTIANRLERPKAVRAVANAIGANPVAYLIPCHRVLRSSGELGGYRWGMERKRLMLGREWAQV
ncbi:MAG: AraC family transcriptional regulator of adaptative response [Gammaproteobacteria bacterium]|jgi:AraC family transcriptional regulator of adaptative response/methylated-DNA-[protein]-cysteine methyltransferase